ncbi:uncharacterized protein YicC (UPF0701 family) [Mycoplasmoides fastidiosum]|uniref:Uncharacterized protein YicC (UPF0701 family) n=1 Tax=Mycoplasmoides fastidiosum TaxID=92758 RepID=A0ABU0LZ70_9BACT|nr:hypothetical protein [Mycoplasmoides fastidiosum]MDQ0513998.1 uncharacterized protein YicC (UPF0701 family) [Mycoplasmoides fastidiosum]UUD37589.1 hypothetical protein NPA10_03410 [Mycoplasmoides fastidiosum]
MKKLNLFKKNKLWLASLGLATTSSLILAACANQNQSANNQNTKTPNNPTNQPKEDNPVNPDNPVQPENPVTPVVPTTPKIPVATEIQKQLAVTVLEDAGVKKVLVDTVKALQDQIVDQIKIVTFIDSLNQKTVADSIKNLGNDTDPAGEANTSTVYALVKTLETNLDNALATEVPEAEKQVFTVALNQVKTDAAALLTSLKALPEDTANKELEKLENEFTKALDEFVKADAADSAAKLTALVEAKNTYQTGVQKVAESLANAEQKAFALDSSASALQNYINTEVGTFLTGNNGSTNTTTLNHLLHQVRTGVLGTLGGDLWTAGNISEIEAALNRPAGVTEESKSTQLYSIIVGLANQNASWKNINQLLKSLTFNQSLLNKTEDATNLLALHVDLTLPVDIARLNAYLINDQSNVIRLFGAISGVNVHRVIENIAHSISNYDTFLTAGSEENAQPKLIQDLTALSNQLTSETDKKGKVDDFKTAAETLIVKFKEFKAEWEKTQLQPLLWTTDENNNRIIPLLNQANSLNRAIGVAKNYGDVQKVVGVVELLEDNISQITNIVATTVDNKPNELLAKLNAIINDIDASTVGSFGKTLNDFATETFTTGESEAAAIAKSGTSKTGYVYTDLVNGTRRATNSAARLSFKQLDAELKNLQAGSNKQLTTITNFLNNQLRPNQSSQTAELNKHLADLFNNGEVQADPENH